LHVNGGEGGLGRPVTEPERSWSARATRACPSRLIGAPGRGGTGKALQLARERRHVVARRAGPRAWSHRSRFRPTHATRALAAASVIQHQAASDEVELPRASQRPGAARGVELARQVVDVRLDGTERDDQAIRDLAAGEPLVQWSQDFEFTGARRLDWRLGPSTPSPSSVRGMLWRALLPTGFWRTVLLTSVLLGGLHFAGLAIGRSIEDILPVAIATTWAASATPRSGIGPPRSGPSSASTPPSTSPATSRRRSPYPVCFFSSAWQSRSGCWPMEYSCCATRPRRPADSRTPPPGPRACTVPGPW
jgi:hypothetical protein